jgi:agmatinase
VTPLTSPISSSRPSFLDAPRCAALDRLDADVTVLGVPFTTPHDLDSSRSSASAAPAALREQSRRYTGRITHHDFDLGGPLFGGRDIRLVDAGDVRAVPGRYEQNAQRAVAALEAVGERGGLPVVLGGDRAAAIPLVRALAAQGPLGIVHFGAELDWRDEVEGVREAAPSTMRRTAELREVTAMMQVGLRGSGHARPGDVEDARRYGSVLVRADDVRGAGVSEVLRHLPVAPRYAVCLDIAAIDPSVAPGVEIPAFGGLTYFEVTNLLRGIVTRDRVAGLALTGIVPACDFHDRTSLLGARLILTVIGALAHAGRLGMTGSSPAVTTTRELATTGARA